MRYLIFALIFDITSRSSILCIQTRENTIYKNDSTGVLLSLDNLWPEVSNSTMVSYELEDMVTSTSFKYKSPELSLQFLHMNINGLSIGTKIFPEFSNMGDLLGGILLHTAVEENNLNMIESLIDIGADLNIKDNEGLTPLYRSVKMDYIETTKLLIDAGANVNFLSNSGDSLLHTCVVRGDTDVLSRLIQLGADTNIPNSDGVTPLYKAAEKSDLSAMEILVAGKANADWISEEGRSLLHIAVTNGRLDVTKELIRIGAKVDNVDNQGSTPLYTSLVLNNLGIMTVLLDNGSNSSFVLPNGDSLLHKAIIDGSTHVLQKLLGIGADMYWLDSQNLTPLYLAIKLNQINAVKTLIRNNVDINRRNLKRNDFPIHFAVKNGTLEAIKVLLDNGAEPFVFNEDGYTPLVLAIFEDKTDIIDVLYQTSPIVNYKCEENGNTPLHLAVIKKDTLSAEKLLKRGAKVDALNGKGLTPLCIAAQMNCGNIMKLLIKNGANVDFKIPFGDTLVHLAVSSKSVSAVVILAESGADLDIFDSKSLTPLCKAISMNATNMINTLLAKGASVDIPCLDELPLYIAVKHSSLATVKRLINLGGLAIDYSTLIERAVQSNDPIIFKYLFNKNKQVLQGGHNRLLLLASYSGSSEIIHELLKLGVPVNMESENGFTPLWFATMNNKPHAMKVLIDNGADLQKTVSYTRDGLELHGWTLLHEAAFNGHEDALEALLHTGLDINAKDDRSWTPLHYAAAQHNLGVIKKLVDGGADVNAKTRMGELPVDLVKRRRSYEPIVLEWLAP